MTVPSSKSSPYVFAFYALETFLMLLAVFISLVVTFEIKWISQYWKNFAFSMLIVTMGMQITFYYLDLYNFRRIYPVVWEVTRLAQATSLGGLFLAVFYYFMPSFYLGGKALVISALLIFLFSLTLRYIYVFALKTNLFSVKLLILASGSLSDAIFDEIVTRNDNLYRVVCILDMTKGEISHQVDSKIMECWSSLLKTKLTKSKENILSLARRYEPDLVIVAMDEKRGSLPIDQLIQIRMMGIPIVSGEDFFEVIAGRIMADRIVPSWLVFSDGFASGRFRRIVKRFMDVVLSVTGLVLSLPLTFLTAIAIHLDSTGPIIFKQERIGKNGKLFNIYKFRSMIDKAEKKCGPVWASENDKRITRVGQIIRKYRLDEIPQMWNVLKGDMSFIGPRPERPVFVNILVNKIPFYHERHNVQPGITGWAQVCFPYGSSTACALEKLSYDLYYIKHSSMSLDIFIVIQTIKITIFGGGGR